MDATAVRDADRVYDCAYNFVSVIPATSARI
jgi:hypothetical protein